MIILLLDFTLSLAILEPFVCVHVTCHVKQSYMKETLGDDHIETLISDGDEACTRWRGNTFAHRLALEKLYYFGAFLVMRRNSFFGFNF